MAVARTEGLESADGSSPSSSSPRLLGPLQIRDFRLLWLGQAVSVVGDEFYFIALSWLTLQLTGSALALGGVLTAAAIPRGILMMAGGALSDRLSRRQVMLISDSTRAVLVAILAGVTLTGVVQLWHLYVLAVLFGTIDAVFYPASDAILPGLVGEGQLPAATALSQFSTRGAAFVGPAAAGILIAVAGREHGNGIAFALDAVTFVLSALTLVLMRGGGKPVTDASGDGADGGILASIREGLRYAWHDPILRAVLFIIAGIDVTLNGVFGVGLPLLAQTHFVGGAAAFGTLSAGFGAGSIVGILAAGAIRHPRRRGLVTVVVVSIFGAGTIVLPFLPNLWLATACIGVMAVGSGVINILMMPWLQIRTDPAMLGRVSALIMLASLGLTPLSYAAAGWLAAANLNLLFIAGGAIILFTASFAALSPARTIN